MTTDDKPKFTPRPWKVHRKEFHKMGIDFTSVSIHSDNSPIGLIAKMPFQNEFLLIKEYKEKFSQEEIDANAALIEIAPDMYDELEKTASFIRHTAEWLEKRLGNIAIVAAMFYNADQIEKLLAKIKGEKND